MTSVSTPEGVIPPPIFPTAATAAPVFPNTTTSGSTSVFVIEVVVEEFVSTLAPTCEATGVSSPSLAGIPCCTSVAGTSAFVPIPASSSAIFALLAAIFSSICLTASSYPLTLSGFAPSCVTSNSFLSTFSLLARSYSTFSLRKSAICSFASKCCSSATVSNKLSPCSLVSFPSATALSTFVANES